MNPPPDPTEAPLHPDKLNRLGQHALHEERLFHDRMHFFSAIQGRLLGVFAILDHKEPSIGVFVPPTAVSLAFTGLCLVVQVRHWTYCRILHERIWEVVPDYRRTVAAFAAPGRTDGLSISRPLSHAVPLLFAAAWLGLSAWMLAR